MCLVGFVEDRDDVWGKPGREAAAVILLLRPAK